MVAVELSGGLLLVSSVAPCACRLGLISSGRCLLWVASCRPGSVGLPLHLCSSSPVVFFVGSGGGDAGLCSVGCENEMVVVAWLVLCW